MLKNSDPVNKKPDGEDQLMEKDILFEQNYKKYYSIVYKYILRRISDPHQAEELTMNAFETCYEKLESYDSGKASFSTWLYTIVNNKLKNYYRDRKIYTDIDDCREMISGFEEEILAAEYIKEMRNNLADALKSLNETQRNIIILKYFKEKSSVEISNILGITAVNVRVNLSRATAKLKEYFAERNIEWEK